MVYAKVVNGYEAWISKRKFLGSFGELKPDKTYIFPTGFGFAFGILTFILLVMAIGYGNNILYFFVFFLVSMGLTTVWLTNKNVDSVRLTEIQLSYLYAKEPNLITAQIENANKKETAAFDIEFRIEYKKTETEQKSPPDFTGLAEVENTAYVSLNWVPFKRGYVRAPRILIQSRFPFKLLRSWKYSHKPNEYLVFPQRKGKENLRSLLGLQSNKDEMSNLDNEGLFRDYREFQNSDSPARIDWKRSVKHQKHLVKNYEKSGDRKILIDWEMTAGLNDFEERVSQMALWVDLCYEQNELFSIKIKNFQTDYFASPNHYKSCMEKLALLKEADVV